MKKVAVVDGVPIYSDKKGSISIINSCITFADGSTCDVFAGTIINKGSGDIRIGYKPRSPAPAVRSERGTGSAYRDYVPREEEDPHAMITRGPSRHSASNLRVVGLSARLIVEPWDGKDVELTITGTRDGVNAISTSIKDGVLTIEGAAALSSSGGVHISGISVSSGYRGHGVAVRGVVSGGSIIIDGHNVSVMGGGSNAGEDLTVTVKVPRGADISLDGVDGDVKIGDVNGTLAVNARGGGEIRCGRMRGATIAILGGTDVHISEVSGPLTANIMGSGDIKVKSGKVTALNVNIMGSGDFCFGGVADTATLSVMGSGDIDVSKVKTKPIKQCMGSGDINVG